MTNNDIFKKLRVALQLRDDQIIEILELVDFRISKGEIGNFFRAPEHPKYIECGDQVLRNFLNALVIHLRGTKEEPKVPMDVIKAHKTTPSKDYDQKDRKDRPATSPSKPKSYSKSNNKKNDPKNKKFNPLGNVKFNNGKPKKKEDE
ncbi:DUF1456 family protein [Flavobacterium sp. JP2137]|uniref:DUF1456 family protein n=1 Tax=Flavobacterium sp. JP2137 TaxID=3414510 RepID=UPI003D2FD1DA